MSEPIRLPISPALAEAIRRREQQRKTAAKAGGTPKTAPAPIKILLRLPTEREKSQAAALTGDGANARILRLAGDGYKPAVTPDATPAPLAGAQRQLDALRAGR